MYAIRRSEVLFSFIDFIQSILIQKLLDFFKNYNSSSKSQIFFCFISELNETFHNDSNYEEIFPLYPTDLFTLYERRNGAIILHIVGVIYMFIALTVVCYEFFVPTLEAIIKKFHIKNDDAAANVASIFIAIGLSASQFPISLFAVFLNDDIAVSAILGAGAFRLLFIIGICAICYSNVLSLKWFTLYRDCGPYSSGLFVLIIIYLDHLIYWWEAAVLCSIYLFHVGFMLFSPYVFKKVVLPPCLTVS